MARSVSAPAPTTRALLERVYRYFPPGIESGDERHHDTEESLRLASVHEAAAIACKKQYNAILDDRRRPIDEDVRSVVDALRAWSEFDESCRREFPDCVVWDESGPFFDPGYRYSVSKPGYVHPSDEERDPVVCAFSVLAPVYVIYTYTDEPADEPAGSSRARYSDFPDRYRVRISKLSALAEKTFGFHRVDEGTVLTPAPNIAPFGSNRPTSRTTLMDCLFSPYP